MCVCAKYDVSRGRVDPGEVYAESVWPRDVVHTHIKLQLREDIFGLSAPPGGIGDGGDDPFVTASLGGLDVDLALRIDSFVLRASLDVRSLP